MSETWWDNDGNEWDSWGGMTWVVGFDPARKKPRTTEEQAEIEKILKEYDAEVANRPILVSEPRNILLDFLEETRTKIEFKGLVEKSSGKPVEFGKANLQFGKENKE